MSSTTQEAVMKSDKCKHRHDIAGQSTKPESSKQKYIAQAREVSSHAARFRHGYWCCCGPGSEKTWKYNEERPSHQFADGEWDKLALKITRSRHSNDGQIDSSFLIGAWPLFVDGVIGLVNSVNGRDHCLLNNVKYVSFLNTSVRDLLCLTQEGFEQ